MLRLSFDHRRRCLAFESLEPRLSLSAVPAVPAPGQLHAPLPNIVGNFAAANINSTVESTRATANLPPIVANRIIRLANLSTFHVNVTNEQIPTSNHITSGLAQSKMTSTPQIDELPDQMAHVTSVPPSLVKTPPPVLDMPRDNIETAPRGGTASTGAINFVADSPSTKSDPDLQARDDFLPLVSDLRLARESNQRVENGNGLLSISSDESQTKPLVHKSSSGFKRAFAEDKPFDATSVADWLHTLAHNLVLANFGFIER
jgi:hypothetical protein